jgi:hypothetical protein
MLENEIVAIELEMAYTPYDAACQVVHENDWETTFTFCRRCEGHPGPHAHLVGPRVVTWPREEDPHAEPTA